MNPWAGSTVLITGGTGSFGRAFTRWVLEQDVGQVRILSDGEPRRLEMERQFHDPRISYLMADVRDRDSLRPAFFDGVDVLIHAAAKKHVPFAEQRPEEFKRTNEDGAENIANAAERARIRIVVGLSSDKGSSPATVYGSTKFYMERLFVSRGYTCTRYGNVTASSGSLIPTLMEQRTTGIVSLTDPRMSRFWMTMGEAVQLVRRAVEGGQPGMVLIPRLPSVRVVDVIEAVAPDCRVEQIGIRGFEKIHESLISQDEIYAADHWVTGGITDYCLGLKEPRGISEPYGSGTNPRFLTVAEIRAALPRALAEAGYPQQLELAA